MADRRHARESRHSSWLRRLLLPTVVAQVVAIGAIILVGASVARSKQESTVGTTPLGVGSRDRLAICIQPTEGLTLGTMRQLPLPRRRSPNWRSTQVGPSTPRTRWAGLRWTSTARRCLRS